MKSNEATSLYHYGLLLTLGLIAVGLLTLWLAPVLGSWLLGLLILMLWGCIGYLVVVMLLIARTIAVSQKQPSNTRRPKLSLDRVMRLRKHMLVLYGVIDLFVFKTTSRLKLQQALIAINNQLLDAVGLQVLGSQILVLTPHCIQRSQCGIKVTGDDNLCTQCGMCTVGDLKSVERRFGISVAIATGGTLARQVLKAKKPALVIAVACERDLVSGLRDASNLPVYGIYNQRPLGPCRDTRFDIATLEDLLVRVIK